MHVQEPATKQSKQCKFSKQSKQSKRSKQIHEQHTHACTCRSGVACQKGKQSTQACTHWAGQSSQQARQSVTCRVSNGNEEASTKQIWKCRWVVGTCQLQGTTHDARAHPALRISICKTPIKEMTSTKQRCTCRADAESKEWQAKEKAQAGQEAQTKV